MAIKKLTDRHQLIMPYLMASNAPRLIKFLQDAFGATEEVLQTRENGDIMHAEYIIEDQTVMLGQANEDYPAASAQLFMYVNNCEGSYQDALKAGGNSVMAPMDQDWGSCMCGVKDPTDNIWWLTSMK